MLRSIVFALTLASASAFMAPSARAAGPQTVVHSQYKNEIGAQVPIGYWDPLALLENADQAKFDRLRFTEIKHGRISMLAVVGYLIGASNVRWAGFADLEHTLKFADVPGERTNPSDDPSPWELELFLLGGLSSPAGEDAALSRRQSRHVVTFFLKLVPLSSMHRILLLQGDTAIS
jgi:hypothetical protein